MRHQLRPQPQRAAGRLRTRLVHDVAVQGYEGNAGRASDGTVFEPQLGKTPRMQAEQMDQDALAILNNAAPRVPGEEGVADMRVLDAAFASARGNGARVEIAR